LDELAKRDAKDQERDWGRLVIADDAILVDTTGKTLDETCQAIVQICEARSRCFTPS